MSWRSEDIRGSWFSSSIVWVPELEIYRGSKDLFLISPVRLLKAAVERQKVEREFGLILPGTLFIHSKGVFL